MQPPTTPAADRRILILDATPDDDGPDRRVADRLAALAVPPGSQTPLVHPGPQPRLPVERPGSPAP